MNNTITDDEGFKKFLQVIGKNLRSVRVAQNKEIGTVAKAMKISDDLLDQIEKGEFNWEVELLSRLCKHYKVPVKEIASEHNTVAVIYTEALKKQLDLVRQTSNELAKEEPAKSVEQLLAEIEFVKDLLDKTKRLIN